MQYAYYVKGVFTFDLGPSLVLRGRTVNDIVKTHFPKSIELGLYAFLFAIVVGVPLGVIAALEAQHGGRLRGDVLLQRLPRDPELPRRDAPDLLRRARVRARYRRAAGRRWEHKILPSIALGFAPMALFARLVRGTMLETLQQDYVRTARAKGLRYRRVVGLHVLRNSLIPVITAAGPLLGFIITGSFVIELIFNIPGIGQYYVTAVNARDYSVVMGLTVLLSRDHHLREPRRRHPLRHPRPAHAGRPHVTVVDATAREASGMRRAARRAVPGAGAPIRQSNLWKDAWRRYIRNKGAVVAGVVFVLILLFCLIWPIISPYDGNEVNFARGEAEPEPGAPARHRQVRPRPPHAHGRGRPRLDPDRLRRDARDPADRRRLRLDLGLRRRPARQRDDALPRRALRPALPALRDHHARDHRHDRTSGR